jgi:hypothetical protein
VITPTFLILALDGNEWSASCPCHFNLRERAPGTRLQQIILLCNLQILKQLYSLSETSLSRQPYRRKVISVQQDLWYHNFGFCRMLKIYLIVPALDMCHQLLE